MSLRARSIIIVFLVLTLAAGASVWWVLFPKVDALEETDATYLLASRGGAKALNRTNLEVYPGRILVSAPLTSRGHEFYAEACSGEHPYVSACLNPVPGTTRGEVRAFTDYAEEHGIQSVTVVTHRTHVSRTRMLFNRCFDGEVRLSVVSAQSRDELVDSYVYEVGAFGKALLLRSC